MSFIDPDDIDVDRQEILDALARGEIDYDEAYNLLRQMGEESSEHENVEESIEQAEDTDNSDIAESDDTDTEDEEELELASELTEEAELYQSFSNYADAMEFCLSVPGVFVIMHNEDTDEYDVYRDYDNADTVG